jgi:hypothetical protein
VQRLVDVRETAAVWGQHLRFEALLEAFSIFEEEESALAAPLPRLA